MTTDVTEVIARGEAYWSKKEESQNINNNGASSNQTDNAQNNNQVSNKPQEA